MAQKAAVTERVTAYAVNSKARGKVHRVTPATARLPPHRQRVACGWFIKRSTSIVYYSRAIKWGTRCLKCFPPQLRSTTNAPQPEAGECIQQFACGDVPADNSS